MVWVRGAVWRELTSTVKFPFLTSVITFDARHLMLPVVGRFTVYRAFSKLGTGVVHLSHCTEFLETPGAQQTPFRATLTQAWILMAV